jgi:hypothetical protein
MFYRHNPGRFVAALSLGAPSVLAVLERHPVETSPAWPHDLHVVAPLEPFVPGETTPAILATLARKLSAGEIGNDHKLLVDLTDAAPHDLRLIRSFAFPVVPTLVRVDDVKRYSAEGVDSVPWPSLAEAIRVLKHEGRIKISDKLTHAHRILDLLGRVEERIGSSAVRALAFALWDGNEYGYGEICSRRPLNAAQRLAQEWKERDEHPDDCLGEAHGVRARLFTTRIPRMWPFPTRTHRGERS